MTTGSVLLLGGTPAFGTTSPTSCKEGSRYMATVDERTMLVGKRMGTREKQALRLAKSGYISKKNDDY